MPPRRWSIQSFADEFLQGIAKQAVLDAAPNDEVREGLFEFDIPRFDKLVNLRVFEVEGGEAFRSLLPS
jgi:hypothetical protein